MVPLVHGYGLRQGIIHTPHRGVFTPQSFQDTAQDQTPLGVSSIASTVTLHYHGLHLQPMKYD